MNRISNNFIRFRSRPSLRLYFQCMLAAVCGILLFWLSGAWGSDVSIIVDMRSSAGRDGELFYASAGEGYDSSRRIPFEIVADDQWHSYKVELPRVPNLARVRVDPGSSPGQVEIRSLSVVAPGKSVALIGEQLKASVASFNQIQLSPSDVASVKFFAHPPDPFVDFYLPAAAGTASSSWLITRWALIAIGAAILWLVIALGGNLARKARFDGLRLPSWTKNMSDRLSEPGVIVVPPSAIVLVLLIILAAVGYVGLNLHQSSIGVWEQMFPAKSVEQFVDLGSPKHTRSDEWNTQTPWVLGQVATGSRDENISIGGSRAPLLAAVPLKHAYSIAQGKFYGFYFLDQEGGFSWLWAYKTFGTLLAFFWLFLLLTKGDVTVSAIGSAWIFGSSFTQWWLSSHLPELLIAFAIATIGGYYVIFARRTPMIIVGCVAILYACLNLMLHLYPPFIVPLAYLGFSILAGVLAEPGRVALVVNNIRWRLACLSITVIMLGLAVGSYLESAMPAINAMTHTSYPGQRVSTSGGLPLFRLFYGFFEAFRVGEVKFPLPPTNASEASNFIIFAPLLLLVIPLREIARKNSILLSVLIYCCFLILWIGVQIPGSIQAGLQEMGWAWSPPARAVIGLGIGSIVATSLFLAQVRAGTIELRSPLFRGALCMASFVGFVCYGKYLQSMDPAFFTNRLVLMSSIATSIMLTGLMFGRAWVLFVGLACAIAPALTVNPLVSGLSSINEKPILEAARDQGAAETDRWAVVGAFVFSQGLKSQGLEVVTGSQMIPNASMANQLDPDGKYKDIWNRYAHVALRSDPGRKTPVYELRTPDLYMIGVDICSADFARTGVTRIAYTDPVPKEDEKCLIPLDAPADSGVRLFRYSLSSGVSPE